MPIQAVARAGPDIITCGGAGGVGLRPGGLREARDGAGFLPSTVVGEQLGIEAQPLRSPSGSQEPLN